MNKQELIEAIASHAELTKADAKKAVDAFIGATTAALKKGDRLALVGFGSFSVADRAARTGRNPQTGKEIKISAKKVVRFKAGAELAETVNKKKNNFFSTQKKASHHEELFFCPIINKNAKYFRQQQCEISN
jgi:DNA-binding protein HU-beta